MRPWVLVLIAYLLREWALFITDLDAMLLGCVLLAVTVGLYALSFERKHHELVR